MYLFMKSYVYYCKVNNLFLVLYLALQQKNQETQIY